jgi:hypothetical protein
LTCICVRPAGAVVAGLNPAVNVVQVDSNTSGVNNSVKLAEHAGSSTVTASGDARFGSNPGEVWNSIAIAYRDGSDKLQYAAAPMNGAGATISGLHYDYTLLTDQAGTIPGNTGSAVVVQRNSASVQVGGGTIFAGSLTPAQTGVAEVSSANAAVFDTTPVPNFYNVEVLGSAFYAPGKEYGSVIVQYRDATNGITYEALGINNSHTFFGYRFRVFLTDVVGQTGDNSGNLVVNFNLVPEPATALVLLPLLGLRRSRRITSP